MQSILGPSKKPSELVAQRGFVLALAGDGGVGKTTLLGTLLESEHTRPVAVFDLDAGSYVLPDNDDLEVFPLKDLKQVDEKRQLLVQHAGTSRFRFKTICWDVVTALQQTELKSNGLTPVLARASDTRRLYGASNLYMQQFFNEQRDLAAQTGLNIILTFWDDPTQDPQGNKRHDLNVTHGSMLAARGLLDLIYYVELEGAEYPPVLITGGDISYSTKNRVAPSSPLHKLPRKIYQPSLATLINAAHNIEPFPFERHVRARKSLAELKAEKNDATQ